MLSRLSVHSEPILPPNSTYIRLPFLGLDFHPSLISPLAQTIPRLTTITMSATPPPSRASSIDTLSSDALPTATSHIPGDHPESPTHCQVSEKLVLWHSLLHVVGYPNTASDTLLDTTASNNNPRPLRTVMQDSADYWVKSSGELFTIKFPAKIDHCGQFGKLGVYFNLPLTGVRLSMFVEISSCSIPHVGHHFSWILTL